MSDWPDNDGKMTSHSNFKLTFFKRSLDLLRGVFKHMTAVSKNVYFDALDDIVNK